MPVPFKCTSCGAGGSVRSRVWHDPIWFTVALLRRSAPLLLLACAAETGDDTAPRAPDAGDAPSGGRVVLRGPDGVYVADAAGDTLTRVSDSAAVVHASGSQVVVGDDDGVTAFDLVTGAAVATFPIACGTTATGDARLLTDAVLVGADAGGGGGAWFAACGDGTWGGGALLRADPDGAWVELDVAARRIAVDRGVVYAIESYGREGDGIVPFDPVTGAPTAEARRSGFSTDTRGDTWSFVAGEVGNSASGAVVAHRWSDPDAEQRLVFEEDAFPQTADVLDGVAVLTSVHAWPDDRASTRLLDSDGATLDTIDGACDHGALAWIGGAAPRLIAWCPAPLRRIAYAWEDGAWQRSEEPRFTESVTTVQLVEAGD
jgi:hypothetical protein